MYCSASKVDFWILCLINKQTIGGMLNHVHFYKAAFTELEMRCLLLELSWRLCLIERLLLTKWCKMRHFEDLDAFKKRKNEATFIMSKARNEFYTQFMEENSEDQGKLFSAAKELLAVEN